MGEHSDSAYAMYLCDRIASCTDVPGMITRTFLSPATRLVHVLLREEMEALGMQVRVDCAGNVRALYGADASANDTPRLLLGSHIDTVPDAGAYDGVLGVAVALALVRGLARERQRLPYALEVIVFSEEEGVRFKLPFIGSRAVTNSLGPEDLGRLDKTGVSVAQAIEHFGLNAKSLLQRESDAALSPTTFGFLEIHIEQGPVLDAENLQLGIVSTIVGQSRLEVCFSGQANHAGTTPMSLRHDALTAASGWILGVEQIARATAGLVATVCAVSAEPGAANVIAGRCTCSLDVRHCGDTVRLDAVKRILDRARTEAAARGVSTTVREMSCQSSVAMDKGLQAVLMASAHAAGVTARVMNSGAGHDAMILASRVPSAMLFVRSPGGISHHPSESVKREDVRAALEVGRIFLEQLARGFPPESSQ